MDPQEAWDQLLAALAEEEWDQVEDFARALLNWLDRGGFPPTAMGAPCLGPDWERAICRAGCQYALEVLSERWTILAAKGDAP